jgi:mannosyl-oligosaccharide glucosidase
MHYELNLSFALLFFCLFGASYVSASDDVSTLIKEVSKASNESLLWGPYKSNLYFGVHPRIPKSLVAGLMWTRADSFSTVQESE